MNLKLTIIIIIETKGELNMTIIIGLVCRDGLVMASDTQSEFERGSPVKRINVKKLRVLNNKIVLGGAGTIALIDKAIRRIEEDYERMIENGYDDLKSLIEGIGDNIKGAEYIISEIHKLYNVDRPTFIYGGAKPEETFDFYIMIGGFSNFNGKMEPDLYILYENGIAEPMKDYATIGSGSAYAEFLLEKYYNESINVDQAVKLTIYVISEVEKMDPNVGGSIDIIKITEKGAERINKELIEKNLNEINEKINIIEKNLKDYFLSINKEDD